MTTDGPGTLSAREALEDLLVGAFTIHELRRFARLGPSGEDIAANLPAEQTNLVQLAHAYVGLLEDRGLLDRAFFDRLVGERSGRSTEIERIAGQLVARGRSGPRTVRRVMFEAFDGPEQLIEPSFWLIDDKPGWRTFVEDGVLHWVNQHGVGHMLRSRFGYFEGDIRQDLGESQLQLRVCLGPPFERHTGAGALFRYRDEDPARGYAFLLQRGGVITWFERDEDSMRPIGSADVAPDPEGWVLMRVEGWGQEIRLMAQGQEIVRIPSARWIDGDAGIMAFGTGHFRFDDVALYHPNEA